MFDKAESIATNTLLIPNIPDLFFSCDQVMLTLHDACAHFGPLYTFVPMKTFRRIMVIFQETAHAIKAKESLDRSVLVWKQNELENIAFENATSTNTDDAERLLLRFYYGQHFSIHQSQSTLEVPQFKRNLLISPPGSPCEGWEQIEEDSPNRAVLASDLIHAADISDYELDDDELELEEKTPPKLSAKKLNVVCAQGLTREEHLPSITVEDYDGLNPIHKRTTIPATPMPPSRHV